MGTSYIQKGDVITFTAPAGGVTKGVPVLIGSLPVVPCETAAATARFDGYVTGVHTVPKTAGQAWTEGALIYVAAGAGTNVATANTRLGVAVLAAASADTTGVVVLSGVGGLIAT